MLKRLRRKFVLVSVASLALVLLVLVIGINAGMRYFNARSADSLLEDMLQEGRAAILAAARDYDAERGALFPTYALPRIRAAMVEYLATASLSVSIPAGRYLQLPRVGQLMKSSAEEQ